MGRRSEHTIFEQGMTHPVREREHPPDQEY